MYINVIHNVIQNAWQNDFDLLKLSTIVFKGNKYAKLLKKEIQTRWEKNG